MPRLLSTKKLAPHQKELLLNAGFSFIEYEAIKIMPQDFILKTQIIKNAIFTSQNAVKVILKKDLNITNCFCVGKKTRMLLNQNQYKVLEMETSSQDLAQLIAERYKDDYFTFFCGNRRRDELPQILKEKNIGFTEIEVYNTGLNTRKFQQKFDGILFFSPSGVQSFTAQNSLKNATAFCIGETTGAEAKKHTSAIEIAGSPAIENVIARAAKHFKMINIKK